MMKKEKILNQPTKISELNFDELYDEISHDWQTKSAALQARRWRAIEHAETSENYT